MPGMRARDPLRLSRPMRRWQMRWIFHPKHGTLPGFGDFIGKGPVQQRYRLTTLLGVFSMTAAMHAFGDWNVTRFKVVPGPVVEYSELLPEGADILAYEADARSDDDRLPAGAVQDVERAINEAADWYRSQGFPAPSIDPVVPTADGPAFQVYLCRSRDPSALESAAAALGHPSPLGSCGAGGGTSGAYVPACNNENSRNRHVYLVADKVLDSNGRLNYGGYQTVAHELFHAIAANTPALRSDPKCKAGKWIGEGLADAISFDLIFDLTRPDPVSNGAYNAPEIWAGRFTIPTDNNSVSKTYGMRPYNTELPYLDKPEPPPDQVLMPTTTQGWVKPAYHTSSFWRFVAAASGEGWRVLLTSPTGSGKGLLEIPFPDNFSGWQREVYWLHQGLRGKYGMGLNMVYATFVNFHAHQLAPISRFASEPLTDADVLQWAEMTFDTCAKVQLTSDKPSDVVDLELKGLASRCIWVQPTNWPGTAQISFQAYSDDESLLEDIVIGRPGAALLSRADPVGRQPSEGRSIALWPDYPQDGSKPALYIVSNVGKKHPARTMPRKISLWISLPGNDVSGREIPASLASSPVPEAHPPTLDRHIPSLKQQRQATAARVAKQMERDKQTLTPDVRAATGISRHSDMNSCIDPFKYDACGPQLNISLTLMPGTYIVPGQTSAQGGIAAQVFGGLQAMSQTSMGDQTGTMKALVASMESIDASNVSIAMPLIDYGYTGSIDNAAIYVDMSGKRKWRTIGPPDATGRSRLTGHVTIDEYSPMVLRGSFSAPLAEFLPAQSADVPPQYVRRDTITGSFRLIAPWQVDDRIEMVILDTQEEMAYDIGNTLGISPDIVRDLQEKGTFSGGTPTNATSPGGSGGSGGTIQAECTCECTMRQYADELCELLCEEEFAACM